MASSCIMFLNVICSFNLIKPNNFIVIKSILSLLRVIVETRVFPRERKGTSWQPAIVVEK